ncbi:phosphate ABC transporter substrate-binding protein, PhoT family [Pedobacter westerhofensis]|uniref:Phosphate ABC transporter substrate-binding protein, PhoT family n=1 Tax=Pedobacter westerhofensis TaxID=425512 RepID=A0A521CCZ7_9SPHI|nr:substrate-binding domain-containing protein [Pedobacter westerhofensis]SMO57308.1 phosphate ABC transporter substrate-binding protein, PhoT family [Pedobacter westerhofensis]
MNKLFFLLPVILFAACKPKTAKEPVEETRTSGTLKMIVDESFSSVLADQIQVFRVDYPDTKFDLVQGSENKILPAFLKDSVRAAVLSRVLTPDEEKAFARRDVRISTSRFAIDGIALITGNDNPDSTITADEVIALMKGSNPGGINLVFDNANSSTLRYFKELAQIKELPKSGIYTLSSNNDVIKYVAEHKNYIGIVGVNWLLNGQKDSFDFTTQVKILAVKNVKGKKGDDGFYKPAQKNLIDGVYPFLRNVYIIKAEVKNDLGTGFANWLVGQRGQLIVLKSGLGPNSMNSRDINIKSEN